MCAATERQNCGSDHPPDLVSVDLAAVDDDGQPLAVWPCRHCTDWHLHVLRSPDGGVFVREWHTATCPHLAAINDED